MGIDNDASFVVRDLWAHKNLTTATGGWEAMVDPHATVMVNLIPAQKEG